MKSTCCIVLQCQAGGRKKMNFNNSEFRPFLICHFKIHIAILLLQDLGRLYNKLLYVLLDTSTGNDISKRSNIDWSRHLVWGHLYIIMSYATVNP